MDESRRTSAAGAAQFSLQSPQALADNFAPTENGGCQRRRGARPAIRKYQAFTWVVGKGGPPSMTLSALSRDTSGVRAAGSSFLLFLTRAFDFSFISSQARYLNPAVASIRSPSSRERAQAHQLVTMPRIRENPAPLHVCIPGRSPRPVSIRQISPHSAVYTLTKQCEAPALRKIMPPCRAYYRRKPVYRETVSRYLNTDAALWFSGQHLPSTPLK
jgi:hypothetical protein